ncbi:MAG: hypothetical protein C0613_01385 [Desulfobulbaceae bacterium]|nr:MAG: hypothetical protein C0613_01385 [Desulfobulbaceae bacterium]
MGLGWRVLVRTIAVIVYLAIFGGIFSVLHVYLAAPPALHDSREYEAGEGPDYFPVLLVVGTEEEKERLVLRSLGRAEYSGRQKAAERSWHLYRLPGQGRLDVADPVNFRVESGAGGRQQVEVSIGEANGQRTSIYTYGIEGNKVIPRSYRLLASFGKNFSPLPFTLALSFLIIVLAEKFLVRRLLSSS